ncbi:MAG TPA: hypothetical protein PLZ76_07950 [Bacillota bacterium]|nr:hypothetical protein [Bacillota bacterium]
MKHNPVRLTAAISLGIALAAGILTFIYQGWYFLIRAAILLPILLLGLFRPRFHRPVRIGLGFLGFLVFGGMILVWTVYPIRRAVETLGWDPGWGEPLLTGLLIGLLGVVGLGFVITAARRWQASRWFPIPWTLLMIFLSSQTILHLLIWKETIGVEFVSYLAYFFALWPLAIDLQRPIKT